MPGDAATDPAILPERTPAVSRAGTAVLPGDCIATAVTTPAFAQAGDTFLTRCTRAVTQAGAAGLPFLALADAVAAARRGDALAQAALVVEVAPAIRFTVTAVFTSSPVADPVPAKRCRRDRPGHGQQAQQGDSTGPHRPPAVIGTETIRQQIVVLR